MTKCRAGFATDHGMIKCFTAYNMCRKVLVVLVSYHENYVAVYVRKNDDEYHVFGCFCSNKVILGCCMDSSEHLNRVGSKTTQFKLHKQH